jgi:uncharacterized protein (TIGR02996 family)
MTDEELAFIRQIVERPSEELPRLIYADWLEEQGDPKGEFIRVQCALSRGSDDASWTAALRHRERDLLREHCDQWIAEIGPGIQWYEPRNGLIESLIVSAESLLTTKGEILARAPIIGLGVALTSLEHVRTLARQPALAYLQSLRLGGSALREEGLAILLDSPHFPAPRSLWLTRCQLGPRAIVALSNSPRLKDVRTLALSGNPIGLAGVQAIAGAIHFGNLEELMLESCEIDASGLEALMDSRRLDRLQTVRIGLYNQNESLRSRFQRRFGRHFY